MIFGIDDIEDDEIDMQRAVIEYMLMAQRKLIKRQVEEAIKNSDDPMEFISQTISLIFRSLADEGLFSVIANFQKFQNGDNGFKIVGYNVLEEANSYISDEKRLEIQETLARISEIFRPRVV